MNNLPSSSSIKSYSPIRNTNYSILFLVLICSVFSLQCKKDLTTTSSSAKLSFSTNLLFFDTVFVSQGSTVRAFVVHNNNNEAVVVSSIKVAGTSTAFFNINVDGASGSGFSNVKIPAKDSIYVFATVTVNPLNQNNPLVINDSIVFTTNGNVQSVNLQAFGWNAYYYVPTVFPKNGPAYYALDCGAGTGLSSTTWMNDKPHVIFGYLLVPPGCNLTINAGAGVYLHDSAVIFVDSGATINVLGNATQPVTFQGDRLEPDYKYLPGQWNEILLAPGSINNNFSWAVLQNGTTGIQADTVFNSNPTLTMDHTIIKGMSGYGLLGEGATITANNCLIADCQYSCLFLWIGGNYHFYQCTFADYWGVDNSFGQRTTSLLYMNNYYLSYANQPEPRPLTNAFFGNCIIYGALDEEVALDSNYNAAFNFYFENCLIKTKRTISGYHYGDTNFVTDPLFTNIATDNYEINSGSPAINNANPGIANTYSVDLEGNTRTSPYNIGAYQK